MPTRQASKSRTTTSNRRGLPPSTRVKAAQLERKITKLEQQLEETKEMLYRIQSRCPHGNKDLTPCGDCKRRWMTSREFDQTYPYDRYRGASI